MVIEAGQVTTGGCVSITVTVKFAGAVFCEVSVAVQFTVVVPKEKTAPEAGLQLKVTPGALSVAVTV